MRTRYTGTAPCAGERKQNTVKMSKEQTLRALVNILPQQNYTENQWSSRVLLPRAGVHTPSLGPGLCLNSEILETPQIKEEPKEQTIKQEEEQLPLCVLESSPECVTAEELSLHKEETQEEDIRSEPHFHSETDGHTELSSNADDDEDWEPPSSTGLSPKSKSAAQTNATINDGHMPGAERVEKAQRKKHQCPFCQKKLGNKRNLQNHIRVHTGEKPYTCSICKKTFGQKPNLYRHMKYHHGESETDGAETRPQCSVCGKRFWTKENLQKHIYKAHAGEKPYSCLLCTMTFAQKSLLDSHMMTTHRGDITFNCSICNKDFPNCSFLKEHLKTYTEETHSSHLSSLLFERTTAESEEESRDSKIETQRKQLLPSSRGAQTSSLSPGLSLNQEIPEIQQIKEEPEEQSVKQEEQQLPVCVPESSTVCVKTEGSLLHQQRQTEPREEIQGGDITSEMSSDTDNDDDWDTSSSSAPKSTGLFPKYKSRLETNDEQTTGAEGKAHQCVICKKRFRRKQNLLIHMRCHTGEKPYNCPICTKTFAQKSTLNVHMRTHRGEGETDGADVKKHQCSVCGKRFVSKQSLQIHDSIHTGERPYSCSLCLKTFVDKTHLKTHMRTHTGERPYSCSICERSFAEKGNLNRHMRKHSVFAVKNTLHTHLKTHTERDIEISVLDLHTSSRTVERFSCSACNKTFLLKSALENHERTHTGAKPFSCSLCKKTFGLRSLLQTHMSSHSGGEGSFGNRFILPRLKH